MDPLRRLSELGYLRGMGTINKIKIMKRLGLQNPRHYAIAQQKQNVERILSEGGFSPTTHPDEIYRRTGRTTIQAVEILEHVLNGESVLVTCDGGLSDHNWNLCIWKNFQDTISKLLTQLHVKGDVRFAYSDAQRRAHTTDLSINVRNLFDNLPKWVWEITDEEWGATSSVTVTSVVKGVRSHGKASFLIEFDGITPESYSTEEKEFMKYVESRHDVLRCANIKTGKV